MGLMDRLKVLNDPAFKAWRDMEERWAEILEVRWAAGAGPVRVAELRLGVHFSGQPVKEKMVTCRVPKGVEPHIGQHVAIHFASRGQYHETAVVIDWDDAPNYGSEPYDPQAITEQLMQQVMTPTPVPPPPTEASLQAKRDKLAQLRDAGALTETEFQQAMRLDGLGS